MPVCDEHDAEALARWWLPEPEAHVLFVRGGERGGELGKHVHGRTHIAQRTCRLRTWVPAVHEPAREHARRQLRDELGRVCVHR